MFESEPLFNKTKTSARNDIVLLEVAINTFVHSPWTAQCEAACLLLRALLKRVDNVQGGETIDGPLLRALNSCRQSIVTVLATESNGNPPLCLAAEHIMGGALRDPGVSQLHDSAFLSGIKVLQTSSEASRIKDTVTSIQELWKTTILSKADTDAVYAATMSDVACCS